MMKVFLYLRCTFLRYCASSDALCVSSAHAQEVNQIEHPVEEETREVESMFI